jgi:hypothetical protein
MVIIAALVLAAFSLLSTQRVKAATSEVTVLTYSWYTAPSNTILAAEAGDLIVVGEVENVGSNVIGNVTLQGEAFSSSEQSLAQATTQAFVYYTLPNQRAPFYLDFTSNDSSTPNLSWVTSVTSVTVTVTSVSDTPNNSRQYSDMTIPASSPYIPGNGSYIVLATVVNNGSQVDQNPWVVATFYNANGVVVGLNFTDEFNGAVNPGGAARFIAQPADDTSTLTSEIANYTLTVDSLTSSTALPTSTPTPTSSNTTSTTQLPTLSMIGVIVVVAIVVIVVVVIAAIMLLRKRQKTSPLPPPPTPQ